MAESGLDIAEVGEETFEPLVLEASRRAPVLVDFWAPWCAPCRMLAPILEEVAEAHAGHLALVKVNTDEHPRLAAAQGIRGLPTVRLYRDGQAVEQFVGVQPRAAIEALLARHLPRESEAERQAAAELRAAGRLEEAMRALAAVVEGDPENAAAHADLIDALLEAGDLEAAAARLAALPANRQAEPEFRRLRARLGFARAAAEGPPPEALERAIAADPGDCEARYRLAAHRVQARDYEQAMEQLLEIVRRDRRYGDDAGRKGLLAVFELLGGRGPLVERYRARMSAALY